MTKQELAELDLAVAKAIQKLRPEEYSDHIFYIKDDKCFLEEPPGTDEPYYWHPSTDWAQGGPIIDEHDIISPTGRLQEAKGTEPCCLITQ